MLRQGKLFWLGIAGLVQMGLTVGAAIICFLNEPRMVSHEAKRYARVGFWLLVGAGIAVGAGGLMTVVMSVSGGRWLEMFVVGLLAMV